MPMISANIDDELDKKIEEAVEKKVIPGVRTKTAIIIRALVLFFEDLEKIKEESKQ